MARTSGAGFSITALPAASAASTPPAGMAYGKFHGEATTTTPTGWKACRAAGPAPFDRDPTTCA